MNSRKQLVMKAAIQLFTEKGFQQTSIQDILDKAQISKGTFYNYFSSKNECLLAILEQRRYEASLRRHEMLIGKDKQDMDVLVQQITVFMQMNQEQNLMAVFEEIFHSRDAELKKIITHHRLFELTWLAERLVDVFGEEARPYVYECSVLFFGMMQYLFISWRNTHNTELDSSRVAKAAMRNISVILPKMIETKEVILDDDAIHIIQQRLGKIAISKEMIIEKLVCFQKGIYSISTTSSQENEFCSYILDELQHEQPRYYVIEALLKPFREIFNQTPHQAEAKEITNYLWSLVKSSRD